MSDLSKLNYFKFSLNINLLKFILNKEKFKRNLFKNAFSIINVKINEKCDRKFISKIIDSFKFK